MRNIIKFVVASLAGTLLLTGSAMGYVAQAGVGKPVPPTKVVACPTGYELHEIRVYGQRLESPDPRPGADHTRHTLIQNDWANVTTDHRYVVALACVRPLNDAENRELFLYGATAPESGG